MRNLLLSDQDIAIAQSDVYNLFTEILYAWIGGTCRLYFKI